MWNLWQVFWKIIITELSWLKGKLNNDKEKICPFLPKSYFFIFSSLLLFPHLKTLVFRCFSINSQVILKNSRLLASNFSILLSNLLKKISIQEFYNTETTTARRKQKIRLWSTGNSYSQIETRTYYMSFFTPLWFFISTSQFWSNTFFLKILFGYYVYVAFDSLTRNVYDYCYCKITTTTTPLLASVSFFK